MTFTLYKYVMTGAIAAADVEFVSMGEFTEMQRTLSTDLDRGLSAGNFRADIFGFFLLQKIKLHGISY